jgi:thiamine pyrophosphokinase
VTTQRGAVRGQHALVLADGGRPTRAGLDAAWPGWASGVGLVVAADGGAHLATDLGVKIDLWVGDGDSLGQMELDRLRAAGVPIELARADKDESDTELALLAALGRGASEVTILGGLGGKRFDHAIANVALLAHPALGGRPARLLDDQTRVTLLSAVRGGAGPVRLQLVGRAGDLVSLLPFGGRVDGVTTGGLRFSLHDEPLAAGPARGLSNVRTAPLAWVEARTGRLLIVESPATLSP